MCSRCKHYLPAIPPADYKGTLAKWIKQLRIIGAYKGRAPKDKYPLRKVWVEEEAYIKVLDACEG
ncbi:MAG: hypothetical protein PHQ20_00625 [Candidatus Moranbacteria bacterium]|nr:hypothetical protein [Candidatus Moranbacteria bacterium]